MPSEFSDSKTSGLPDFKVVSVIGLPTAVTTYGKAIDWIKAAALLGDRAYAVEAANTHVAALSRHDRGFGEVMSRFDLICPDGMPLVWSVNRKLDKGQKLTDRVYGPTLMLKTIEATQGKPEFKHFFFGGKPITLDKLQERFATDSPDTEIVGVYSPPFGEWPEDEFQRICHKIRASGANLVWVGLGCPKQEHWIAQHKDRLPPAVYFGIGAAFAFHAGEVRQAPALMQRYGIEWLYRLCREPGRLWKRYLKYNSLFIYYYLLLTPAISSTISSRPLMVTNSERPSQRINVLGVGISILNLESVQKKLLDAVNTPGFQGYVTITGVHGVVESQHNEELKKIHNRSFLTTPDGMPMVWLGKWNGHEGMDRVYGPELMLHVMAHTSVSGHSHYFYGGAEGVAQQLEQKLVQRYDGLKVVGTYSPPFRPLNEDEEQALHDELQACKPHFVWVGLSTPKQEKFMHDFLAKYPDLARDWPHGFVMLGVGAAFDFHSGRVRQAPYWVQRSGFEWLYRTMMDPRRLLPRYMRSNIFFTTRIFPQMMGLKEYPMPR